MLQMQTFNGKGEQRYILYILNVKHIPFLVSHVYEGTSGRTSKPTLNFSNSFTDLSPVSPKTTGPMSYHVFLMNLDVAFPPTSFRPSKITMFLKPLSCKQKVKFHICSVCHDELLSMFFLVTRSFEIYENLTNRNLQEIS